MGERPTVATERAIPNPPIERWPRISAAERQAVTDVLDSGQLTAWWGDLWDQVCAKISAVSGDEFVLPTCNGTTALHLAAMAVGVSPGDDVLLPSYAYFALAAPCVLLGANPVFCNVSPVTLNVDAAELSRRRTPRTKVAFISNSWGNPAPLAEIRQWSDEAGVAIISDASHAPGARFGGRGLGPLADCTCYGFGLGKAVSAGEFGAVTTSDPLLYERLLTCGGVRSVPVGLRGQFEEALPLKTRPHVLALAIADVQFDRLNERIAKTSQFARTIEEGISGLSELRTQKVVEGADRVYHRLVLSLDRDEGPRKLMLEGLRDQGVPLLEEEYSNPLHCWRAISGRDFLHDRFKTKLPPSRGLGVTTALVSRTVPIRVYVEPDPPDLAERIVAAFHRVWREHG